MKFSISPAKRVVDNTNSVADLLAVQESLNAAWMELTDTQKNFDGIQQIMDNINFSINAISKYGADAVKVLNSDGSLESLLGIPEKLITVEKAQEGLGDAFQSAWDKLIEWIKVAFAKIAQFCSAVMLKLSTLKKWMTQTPDQRLSATFITKPINGYTVIKGNKIDQFASILKKVADTYEALGRVDIEKVIDDSSEDGSVALNEDGHRSKFLVRVLNSFKVGDDFELEEGGSSNKISGVKGNAVEVDDSINGNAFWVNINGDQLVSWKDVGYTDIKAPFGLYGAVSGYGDRMNNSIAIITKKYTKQMEMFRSNAKGITGDDDDSVDQRFRYSVAAKTSRHLVEISSALLHFGMNLSAMVLNMNECYQKSVKSA